jgi:hypothetical protein
MQVICKGNTGKSLKGKSLPGNTQESLFDVTVGKLYAVFAIAVYCGSTLLLLCDDNALPNWYPIDLFSIEDAHVPQDWFGAMYPGNDNGLQFLLGYEQMITDDAHYDDLLERSPAAIEVFREMAATKRT